MASFDWDTFLKVQGEQGASVFEAVGMSFGVPSCMLNLANNILSILPTSVIDSIQTNLMEGKAYANDAMSSVFKALYINNGIIEFDTEEGIFKFKSDSSWLGMDNDNAQSTANLGGLGSLFGLVGAGVQIYQNFQNISDQVNSVIDCLDKFTLIQSFDGGNSANQKNLLTSEQADELFNEQYGADVTLLQNTASFIDGVDASLKEISAVKAARAANPALEPRILDSAELDAALSSTNFPRFPALDPGLAGECVGADGNSRTECEAAGGIWKESGQCLGASGSTPGECAAAGGVWVTDVPDLDVEGEEVFRLVYGPPVTQTGQYLLTTDGLYYDSQEGGLDPIFLAISGVVPIGDAWKYDYDPNLGGKGEAVSIKSLNTFIDNIFDIALVDDSIAMQSYYDADHFLSVLLGQRDKHVYDLSAQLDDYILNYGEDSSIVRNQRQQIISEIASHNNKIDRRKKQIEVAIKAPQIYGGDFQPPTYPPGEIPINDFSYLEQYNLVVDLQRQRALVFEQAEVEGMVLPIIPTFVKSPPKPPSIGFIHLNVPPVGTGGILYTPSGPGIQQGTVLSLSDRIVLEKLFAIYNFLETKLVTPSSVEYKTLNCATKNQYNNSKLVGTSRKSIFRHGLSIPYLEGITKNKSTDTAGASALGSYVRLPDTEEFRELTYNPSGFTIEFWSFVPDIMDGAVGWASGGASSLTKVILGCENVGVKDGASALNFSGSPVGLDFLPNDLGDQFVRGMLMGFTRDKRITQASAGFSNDNESNNPVSSLSFFIAPTQSRDSSSCSWINNDSCETTETFYKMKVDLSATDFGNVSSQYVLVDITADPSKDEIKFYADGSLVATSAISTVFGVRAGAGPSLPTFKKANSFEYSVSTVDGPTTLHQGPKLNPFYTPWIVGGGYTDGMSCCGNFMGGDRGGIQSGYGGFLGSLKFYQKSLTPPQVLQNYKAQQGYFKNIDTKLHEFNINTGEGYNIVLIISDDVGVDNLGIYDGINPIELPSPSTPFSNLDDLTNGTNLYPHTPALSGLARNGITFFNTHVSPVCSPTRAAILTGKQAFSSPAYSRGAGKALGFWGHGVGAVGTQDFERMRGGLAGLGNEYTLYDAAGNQQLLSRIVKSAEGKNSSWTSGVNFKILPELVGTRGYQSAMAGKWHLGEWNEIAAYYETNPDVARLGASGAGWAHVSAVGKWDRYSTIFHNLNKAPTPGHDNSIPNMTTESYWDALSMSDANMGYVNFSINKDGNITTVSDSGYTKFIDSKKTTAEGHINYLQESLAGEASPLDVLHGGPGDGSSYATFQTMSEASGLFNTLKEPFFLYVPLNAPHAPQTFPPSGQLYNWDGFYSTNNVQHSYDLENAEGLDPDGPIIGANVAASATFMNSNAQIENVDYMVSAFIDSLDADKRDRTIFIFMGDNGATNSIVDSMNTYASALIGGPDVDNSGLGPVYTKWLDGGGETYLPHRKGGANNGPGGFKQSVYERGTLIPMIVSSTCISNPNTSSTAFVDAVDIYATIAHIAGCDRALLPDTNAEPQRFEGESFLGILSGTPARDHLKTYSFAEYFSPQGNSTASGASVMEVDGTINNKGMGTWSGKVGKYTGATLGTTDALGGSGNATIPTERRRALSLSASPYKYGHHTVSGANGKTSIYSSLPEASGGLWKLVRPTSGYLYNGSGFDELYQLRAGDGSEVDPYELDNILLGMRGAADTAGQDMLTYILDNADQRDNLDRLWIIARIYYTLLKSLNDYLDQRTPPLRSGRPTI